MNNWAAPQRPNDYAEQMLVQGILDGSFAPGKTLPGERTLATQLGVTRPTLREAIQRLTRDGWLTVQHGKPTLVNDYWRAGGLNVLGTLVQHSAHLPPDFVANLLEIRLQLAPAYTAAAVLHAAPQVTVFLAQHETLSDTPAAYAAYDWQLHHQLTLASGNPIYTLILNGFADFYEQIARLYFAQPAARRHSLDFYSRLQQLAEQGAATRAEVLCRQVMEESIHSWENGSQALAESA